MKRHRRRRLFSYSLRTLLLLTAIAAAFLGVWVNRAERQRRAVAAIREAGGDVQYDSKPRRFEYVRRWISKWIGRDYVIDVASVNLDRSATDAGLVHLRELTNLNELNIAGTQVTDAGLVYLRGLPTLEWLWLTDTDVSDAGLVHLRGLTKLKYLDLSGTKESDAGLAHLRRLTKLEYLHLDGTKVTDAGCDRLRQARPNCRISH